jgi:hypothetical protein
VAVIFLLPDKETPGPPEGDLPDAPNPDDN